MEKYREYGQKIAETIQQMLADEQHENHIDFEELKQGDNFKHFMHALVNVAPTVLYMSLAKEEIDALRMNHLANEMVFEFFEKYGNKIKDNETV